jgi:integrase
MARIYWRSHRAGPARAWGDFTSLGYGREPLIEPGSPKRLGTTSPAVAAKVFADRVRELEQTKVDRAVLGVEKRMTLGEFVPQHLTLWRQEATVTETWLKETGARLQSGAIRFFGADRPLLSITSREVLRFKIWLKDYSNGRGGTLSGSTQRKYLEALSGLFTAAIRERAYNGPNPVAGIVKPLEPPPSEEWFELCQTAALLEAARTYQPVAPGRPLPECGYALIAFIALTGCRMREAFGIEVEDVDFTRRVIRIHPNSWRRLKTPRSSRVVPLWPQLAEILSDYIGKYGSRLNRLLFPSERLMECGKEGMITDARKMLDTLGGRVGFQPGEVRWNKLRHGYATARLQTLDNGAPVSTFTVARELGHTSVQLVERIYGHLGKVRHRSEVVEFRIEQHAWPIVAATKDETG